MKLFFAFALMCSFFSVKSQAYKINFSELSSGRLGDHSDNKVDVSKKGWESEAKIIFFGIGKNFNKIKLKQKGTITEIPAEKDKGDDLITFIVSSAFRNKQSTFIVDYDNKPVGGEVSFELENIQNIFIEDKNGEGDEDDDFESYVGALASANFVGNNKFLANLTPIVNLGGILPLVEHSKWFSWELDVNPYVGGEIDTKDSISFVPALMLPGKCGFVFNNYLNFKMGKVNVTFMPFGFGLKFMPNLQDSGLTILQHNIRGGLSLRYDDAFLLSAQISHGWHNLTSQSKQNFQKIFSTQSTDFSYITALAQMALRAKNGNVTNYIYFEWRSLLSRKRYEAFTNNTILTLGLRKTLELGGGGVFRAAKSGGARGAGRKRMHYNL